MKDLVQHVRVYVSQEKKAKGEREQSRQKDSTPRYSRMNELTYSTISCLVHIFPTVYHALEKNIKIERVLCCYFDRLACALAGTKVNDKQRYMYYKATHKECGLSQATPPA